MCVARFPSFCLPPGERLVFLQMKGLPNMGMVNRLTTTTWPYHLDTIDGSRAPQSKMERGSVLRKVGALTADNLQVRAASGKNAHQRADSLAVALLAFETDFYPIALLGAVRAKQNQRSPIARNRQVGVAVVIEVGDRQSASVERTVELWCDGGENILVLRAIVVEQEGLLRNQQLMIRSVFERIAIDYSQIQEAVIVIIEESTAPSDHRQ